MTSKQPAGTATWITARALLAGWALWTVFILWVLPLVVGGDIGVALVPSDPIDTAWTLLTAPIGIQASLGRPFSMAIGVGLPLIVWAVCGFLAARLHRSQQKNIVLLFSGSILFTYLLICVAAALQTGPFRGGLPAYLSAGRLAANAAASIFGVLFGGWMSKTTNKRFIVLDN